MFPILQLGPLAIQVPGLFLLAGVWFGLLLSEKEAARLDLSGEAIYNLAFTGLIAGVIGARLVYVARYLSAYAADTLGILSLNPATLAPTEGLFIGAVAMMVYGERRQLPLRPTLDALAPALAVMAAALAFAHLASGDAFGAPVRLPWSIYLWDEYRHPTQVYEMVAAVAVLIGALRRPFGRGGRGLNFLCVVALSALARIFLEAFRGDSLLWPGGFRAAQVAGLGVLGGALGLARGWVKIDSPDRL